MSDLKAYKQSILDNFRPSKDFKKKYTIIKPALGKGHFSIVHKAHSINNKEDEYAVKMVQMKKLKNFNEVRALENEINILSKLVHPGIIRLYDMYSNGKDELWLVEELAPGGELFSRIIARSESGLYTEQEAARLVKNLVSALAYLHEQPIVHRDVKPENILLRNKDSETRLKLADFGFAAYCKKPLNDPYGTPVYVAPEILVGEPYRTTPDMWSVGVITFILLCGYPPFFHNNQEVLAKMIVRTGFKFDPNDWKVVSDDAKNFIRGLLKKNPKKRITAKDALQHTWLQNYAVAGKTMTKYLTINTELKKFRGKANLVKAFGAIKAFEMMKRLVDRSKEV